MIITIDTSKDSHQDIRKLIKFLQHHVGESNIYNNSLENKDIPIPSAGVFDMFGDNPSTPSDSILSDANSLLNKEDEQKEVDDDVELMSY